MKKWTWLLPAIALWSVLPATQAQFPPRYGPGQPGRYDPQNPLLNPPPGMSPTLQNIYRDAQTATAPWPRRDPYASNPLAPLQRPGSLNPVPPAAPPPIHPGLLDGLPTPGPTIGGGSHGSNPLALSPAPGPLSTGPTGPTPNLNLPSFDRKLFESRPPLPVPPAVGGVMGPGPKVGDAQRPAWFRWEYPAGILLIALLAGMLYRVCRRDSRTE